MTPYMYACNSNIHVYEFEIQLDSAQIHVEHSLNVHRNEPVVETRFSDDEVMYCFKSFLHRKSPWNLYQMKKTREGPHKPYSYRWLRACSIETTEYDKASSSFM